MLNYLRKILPLKFLPYIDHCSVFCLACLMIESIMKQDQKIKINN